MTPCATTIDLAAYRRRVGLHAGPLPPTVATLRRLHRAHVDAIPFVSVQSALGIVPDLDLETLERRLVTDGRGGYCLEHVTLYAAVLDCLGFAPALRLAAVGGGMATHLTVLAQPSDDPRPWMSDVGFGVGILEPLPVPNEAGPGEPVRRGMFEHRVDRADDALVLRELGADGWRELHVSADTAVTVEEIAEANRQVATASWSPFAGRLIAMRTDDESRERLRGTQYEITLGRAAARTTELSPAEAVEVLQRRFGVALDPQERSALVELLDAAG